MREQLLDSLDGAARGRQAAPQMALPRLRGGDGEELAAFVGGCCVAVVVLLFSVCVQTLHPNEFGLMRNYLTGSIGYEVSRGGIHLTGPFKGYVPFPAATLTLQWSRGVVADRPPIVTRTGADPQDPDSGGQPIQISCAVQYKFVREAIPDVYLSFGSFEAAEMRYVLLAGNMISNTAQDYVPVDFWVRRDDIAERMLEKINKTLWRQGSVVATHFEILRVDFAEKYEDTITQIQVAEQSKVVNEYEQAVQSVVQGIEVLRSENNALIANISAGAEAKGKEIRARANRDAFALKQGMKATKYAQLQKRLDFNQKDLEEYFKIQVLQSRQGKTVVGLPGLANAPGGAPAATPGHPHGGS